MKKAVIMVVNVSMNDAFEIYIFHRVKICKNIDLFCKNFYGQLKDERMSIKCT